MITGGRARSKDGTEIAYLTVGSGPTLLCLHGAFSSGVDWIPVARLLASDYRLVLMDRRGHGSSSSGISGHDMELEHQDIEAVLADQPEPAFGLLTHSFGGGIGLSMVLRGGLPLRRVVAIEPPMTYDVTPAQIAEFDRRMSRGEYEEAVIWGFRDVQGLAEPALRSMMRSPRGWAEVVGAAPMMGRHWEMSLTFPAVAAFASFDVPVLLMYGTRSEERPFKESTRRLAATIPGARLEVLDGHHHLSMIRDPEPVAARIRAFLEDV